MKNIDFGVKNLSTSKRIGNLFNIAFTRENLYLSYLDAVKGKRKKPKVFEFEKNLGFNLSKLYDEIHSDSYVISKYSEFTVYEPKERVIRAPSFRDLIVQHAIYRTVYNIFNNSFIDTSFACRKGGGTHKSSEYTQREMKKYSGELYYAKLDIRKFFYSIDRDVLKSLFEKKIKDKKFIDLMVSFSLMDTNKGIPIGNLLSQLYALVYLNELDGFVKRELKIKSYVRYVDDFMAIGLTLDKARSFKDKCEKFVQDNLKLELSHWTIQKIKKGINFVGYRTWKNVKFVRKHSMYSFRKSVLNRDIMSIASSIGHAKGTASLEYYRKIILSQNNPLKLPNGVVKCLNI